MARGTWDHPPIPRDSDSAGAVLGTLAEAPTYLIADRLLLDQFLTYLTAAFASYTSLAYSEVRKD